MKARVTTAGAAYAPFGDSVTPVSSAGRERAEAEPTDLAFIINSHNRLPLLRRALASIVESVHPLPGEIVVVDDGSTDGSAEFVGAWARERNLSQVRLIRPPERVAFAGGVNLGIAETRAPYVCLFETDNIALDSGVWRAVAHMRQHPIVAAVGFRVVREDGGEAGCGQGFPRPLAFVLGQQLSQRFQLEAAPATPARQEVVYTSPLVVSRTAVTKVGGMDSQRFPFCDSDVDWCKRIIEAGYEIHLLPDVTVVHDNGTQQSEFSLRRTQDFHRARLAYFAKHSPSIVPALKAGLLARHVVELGILVLMKALGAGGDGSRVRRRLELLRTWSRDYRSE